MPDLIYLPKPPHKCREELPWARNEPVGTVYRCDCGRYWQAVERDFGGRIWREVSERKVNRILRRTAKEADDA